MTTAVTPTPTKPFVIRVKKNPRTWAWTCTCRHGLSKIRTEQQALLTADGHASWHAGRNEPTLCELGGLR